MEKMDYDKELDDLLFEIEDCFDTIKRRASWIHLLKTEEQFYEFIFYCRLNINDLLFYLRALRDKLNENESK